MIIAVYEMLKFGPGMIDIVLDFLSNTIVNYFNAPYILGNQTK